VKIIFLDIDGVLNGHQYAKKDQVSSRTGKLQAPTGIFGIVPSRVALLNQIVERTGAKVVVSSTWRRMPMPVIALQAWLDVAGFRGQVIATTPILDGEGRGREIDWWIVRLNRTAKVYGPPVERCESFVILDDDSDMVPHMDRLVQTEMYFGLKPEHVERAVALLGRSS